MIFVSFLGFLMIFAGAFGGWAAHKRRQENHVTAFMAMALFGLGMVVIPAFSAKPVSPAEAATPVASAPAPRSVYSGTINFPPINLDASGHFILASAPTPMEFELCLQAISMTASKVGVAPTNIVETNIVRIVRFPTTEGSIMMTCSRPDQRLVVTFSPNNG